MPSGAKKRKAAKKKKQLGGGGSQINPSSNTSQGNEDVKNQDDKISDNGEIDSPTSQNHLSDSNPFDEGNKEIQESSSSNAAGVSNVETNQKARLASDVKNASVRNESEKGSHDGDRSTSTSTSTSTSSSSSSSDAEDTTKKPEVLDGKTGDLVVPIAASIVNSVTPEVLASEETIDIVESASVENTTIPDIIASKKLETAPSRTNEVTYVPVTATRDISSKPNEDRNLHLSAHITENPESFDPESEDQPLIEPRPPVPQRTSWLSCCGLCDIITGSNR